jgi:hypothetical protein
MFKPGNSVTIAEVLKMAMKAARIDESKCINKPTHKEVIGHWAQAYASCGEQMNIRIFQSDTVDMNRKATRAEVVGIIFDTFGDKVPRMYSKFKDTAKNPYESDVAYAELLGIVSGDKKPDGTAANTFRPYAVINRAEVTKIIYERLKIQAKKDLAARNTAPAI